LLLRASAHFDGRWLDYFERGVAAGWGADDEVVPCALIELISEEVVPGDAG
jgi:hypothetical protein